MQGMKQSLVRLFGLQMAARWHIYITLIQMSFYYTKYPKSETKSMYFV